MVAASQVVSLGFNGNRRKPSQFGPMESTEYIYIYIVINRHAEHIYNASIFCNFDMQHEPG
jgi:hypothetical protein